jgi:hypothetical protein
LTTFGDAALPRGFGNAVLAGGFGDAFLAGVFLSAAFFARGASSCSAGVWSSPPAVAAAEGLAALRLRGDGDGVGAGSPASDSGRMPACLHALT